MQTLTGIYHPELVFLSIVTAMLTSYTALELMRQIGEAIGDARRLWLSAGAVVLGVGIWSTHFIGMLAFSLPVPMNYDASITLVSLLVAITASAVALHMTSGETLARSRWFFGGTLMGLGIAAMHYIGMATMRMEAAMRYDQLLLALTIALTIGTSLMALWLAFQLRNREQSCHGLRKLGAAVVMWFAITGMHYLGMSGTHFYGIASVMPSTIKLSDSQVWLGVAVAAADIMILGTALIITLLNRHVLQRLFTGHSLIVRYWVLTGAFGFVLALWLMEATLHAFVFDKDHGILDHLLTSDPNELWMRLLLLLTVTGFAIFGQRMFSISREQDNGLRILNRKLETAMLKTEQASQAKSRFIGIMSHELLTPLNPAIGFSELLLMDDNLTDLQRSYAEEIHAANRHLLSLINNILELSQKDTGDIVLENKPINLASLVYNTEVIYSTAAEEKGLDFELQLPDMMLPIVVGDENRMHQVLALLLDNAVKFTDIGKVTLRLEVQNKEDKKVFVCFTVVDTGIGIPENLKDNIFHAFTQADDSHNRRYDGAGLGLAMCKMLVELMEGTISVDANPAGGSCFKIKYILPLVPYHAGLEEIINQEVTGA